MGLTSLKGSDMDEAFTGTCENCGKKKVKARKIKAIGMFRENRGYFTICFECFGEQLHFISGDKEFYTPKKVIEQ